MTTRMAPPLRLTTSGLAHTESRVTSAVSLPLMPPLLLLLLLLLDDEDDADDDTLR